MRVLIVEDDAEIAANIYDFLQARGHEVDAGRTAASALHLLEQHPFDCAVLDLGLPGMDGLQLAQHIRQQLLSSLPILMLTARDTLNDKLAGFAAGADDYLVKPFSLKELEARLLALVKRAQGRMVHSVLQHGDLRYDPFSGDLHWQGRLLKLPPKALTLLVTLLRQPGRLFSREELECALWGEPQASSDNLRTQLAQLRRELTLDDGRSLVETVHGRGYRLVRHDAV